MAVAVVSNIEWMWRPVECGANCTGPFKGFLTGAGRAKSSLARQFVQNIDPIFGSCDTAVGTERMRTPLSTNVIIVPIHSRSLRC